jgi:hypothetical protein
MKNFLFYFVQNKTKYSKRITIQIIYKKKNLYKFPILSKSQNQFQSQNQIQSQNQEDQTSDQTSHDQEDQTSKYQNQKSQNKELQNQESQKRFHKIHFPPIHIEESMNHKACKSNLTKYTSNSNVFANKKYQDKIEEIASSFSFSLIENKKDSVFHTMYKNCIEFPIQIDFSKKKYWQITVYLIEYELTTLPVHYDCFFWISLVSNENQNIILESKIYNKNHPFPISFHNHFSFITFTDIIDFSNENTENTEWKIQLHQSNNQNSLFGKAHFKYLYTPLF